MFKIFEMSAIFKMAAKTRHKIWAVKIQNCMATDRNFSMSGINSGHHYLPTYHILMISDNVEFLPPIFYTVFWQPFWKWQTSRKFWTCRIAPLMVRNYRTEFHETWWSYRYMFLVDPKVFRFVVKRVKVIFLGVQREWGLL
jgi:hypothetical protein